MTRLRDGKSVIPIPPDARDFHLPRNVLTASESRTTSCSMDKGDTSHEGYSGRDLRLTDRLHTVSKVHSAIYIHSNEIHNVVALIKCSLVFRCQLYMFRTVTVHPQEPLCRYCMCRLWYVLIRPAGTTFEEALYQLDVSDSAFLNTYHSLHIQYL